MHHQIKLGMCVSWACKSTTQHFLWIAVWENACFDHVKREIKSDVFKLGFRGNDGKGYELTIYF